ncbi:hypothetical protein PMAYCL1PPCAC_04961, partial [Pristionchus mayeri]
LELLDLVQISCSVEDDSRVRGSRKDGLSWLDGLLVELLIVETPYGDRHDRIAQQLCDAEDLGEIRHHLLLQTQSGVHWQTEDGDH